MARDSRVSAQVLGARLSYKTLRVSPSIVRDLVRALWLAESQNQAEGIWRPNPIERQHDALARIVLEWSTIAVTTAGHSDFHALSLADWLCPCGSSGLGTGGLTVTAGRVSCLPCLAASHNEKG